MRDRSRPMQADIVESAQRVAIAQHHDRVVSDFGGEECAVLGHLIQSPDQLPGVGEDALALEFEIDRIVVQAGRNCGRPGDVGIEREDEGHGCVVREMPRLRSDDANEPVRPAASSA